MLSVVISEKCTECNIHEYILDCELQMLIVCVFPEMFIYYVKPSLLVKFERNARSYSSKSAVNATIQV